jgi:pimeloyl-ACP methyl ester carboxylesterase
LRDGAIVATFEVVLDPVTALAGGALVGVAAWYRPMAIARAALRARLHAAALTWHRVDLPSGHVRFWSGGQGRPVTFVHGFGTEAAFNWHGQLPAARRAFRVVAPDLPGFGASCRPSANTVALQVQALAELLDHLGIARTAIVGHSMGGWISLAFAATHPERVERLVLVDAAGLRFDPDFSFERVLLPETLDDLARLLAANFRRPPRLPRFVMRDILRHARHERAGREALLQRLVYGDDHVDELLGRVTAPALLVWGRNDPITPLAIGERLAGALPDARLVVFDDCAHSPNIECASRFNAVMLPFLRDGSTPAHATDVDRAVRVTAAR